ncbi:tetratricopeptide repeat protein [Nocardiopsis baichengensis]|uniref:tetratricopeptide repeat protein n=1 Tax=Nocardiopsis baichengensis TaxID=280240 RepID=UPI00034A55DD|nr:tetratricopeptide repeat protein [Nocardiopsis baichengensis]
MHDELQTTAERLPEGARTAFARLGLHPLPRYSLPAVRALAGTDDTGAHRTIDHLADARLLGPDGPGVWRMGPDAHRLARERAGDLAQVEADAATDRLLQAYLLATAAADADLDPWRWRWASEVFDRAEPTGADPEPVLAWWAGEGETVRALVRLAGRTGRHRAVVEFADTCTAWFLQAMPVRAWEEILALATHSANVLGDADAAAYIRLLQAQRHTAAHQWDQAAEAARAALEHWRTTDHTQGAATALGVLAEALTAAGHPAEALPHAAEALDLHTELGNQHTRALQLCSQARILTALGRHHQALRGFTEALDTFTEHGDTYQQAQVLIGRVPALIATGRIHQGAEGAFLALASARTHGRLPQQAQALQALAEIAGARGETEPRCRHLEEAHKILAGLGSPDADRVADQLAREVR